MHKICAALSVLLCVTHLRAQPTDTLFLSLSEVIVMAQDQSPAARLAQTRMRNRYWFYRSFQADYKPQIVLEGDLPDLNRSIGIITQPDGKDLFVQRAQMRNRLGLSLQQRIAPTGATIFASTGLQRLDIFQTAGDNLVSYFSTPLSVGFSQPLFSYNALKWNRRIEPLRYEEATRQYAAEMENVALESAGLFFAVHIAQLNLEAAVADKRNADTLYNISQGRFGVGRIAETELLQIELSAMNADVAVQQALLDLQTGTERLRNFLGIRNPVYFRLYPPEDVPVMDVDADSALALATANRSEVVGFDRRLEEAAASVAEAKANAGFQVNVFGQFSLSQTAPRLDAAYRSPLDNELFSIGVQLPIFDWGKATARLETALSNQALEQMNIGQQRINFEQEIRLKVNQFALLTQQVAIARRAYQVSLKRAELTRNRYYIGKIGVLDLNIAVSEKENARKNYIASVQAYWLAHYELRTLTLFDFERNVSLVRSVDFIR
ncbi:MAG: hypothetical protein RLY31_3116 [Bacteroidota bacterium]|jgi:outer membrane protein TolC